MSVHAEVPIKVNAWVDEGVAPLVEALNRFPSVRTLTSSSEDRSGDLGHGAFVTFVHTDQTDSGSFIAGLARTLRDGPDASARLQVDWRFGEGDYEPLLTLSCDPELVGEVAHAVAGRSPARLRALRAGVV